MDWLTFLCLSRSRSFWLPVVFSGSESWCILLFLSSISFLSDSFSLLNFSLLKDEINNFGICPYINSICSYLISSVCENWLSLLRIFFFVLLIASSTWVIFSGLLSILTSLTIFCPCLFCLKFWSYVIFSSSWILSKLRSSFLCFLKVNKSTYMIYISVPLAALTFWRNPRSFFFNTSSSFALTHQQQKNYRCFNLDCFINCWFFRFWSLNHQISQLSAYLTIKLLFGLWVGNAFCSILAVSIFYFNNSKSITFSNRLINELNFSTSEYNASNFSVFSGFAVYFGFFTISSICGFAYRGNVRWLIDNRNQKNDLN